MHSGVVSNCHSASSAALCPKARPRTYRPGAPLSNWSTAVTLLSSARPDDCSTCICATWDVRSASGQETLGSFAGLGELERARQVLYRFFAPLAP